LNLLTDRIRTELELDLEVELVLDLALDMELELEFEPGSALRLGGLRYEEWYEVSRNAMRASSMSDAVHESRLGYVIPFPLGRKTGRARADEQHS
jgi:hypothetical protein